MATALLWASCTASAPQSAQFAFEAVSATPALSPTAASITSSPTTFLQASAAPAPSEAVAASATPQAVAPTATPPATSAPAPTAEPTAATASPAASAAPVATVGRTRETIGTRPGVTLRFVLDVPSDARGTVVLFVGGDGRGAFTDLGGQIVLGPNFPARSAPEFTRRGFAFALLDVPSDQRQGMSDAFRTSPEHAQDVQKVIDVLGERGLTPIHLVGTSRGTVSAAALALNLADRRVEGIVLTSTYSFVGTLPLERITRPTLFVNHGTDQCGSTPFSQALQFKARVTASPRAGLVEALGGLPPPPGLPASLTGPCDPFSRHGFYGIETQVVQAITDWLSGKSVPAVVGQ